MENSYQHSTIAQILEDIIAQLSFEGETHSNIADILLSILNQTSYDKEPHSVLAELFLKLKAKVEGEPFDPFDKAYTSRIAEILLSILNETEYTDLPHSRIAELLLQLKEELEEYTEITVSGTIVSFTTNVSKPLVKLEASIVATQTGSGDPSPENERTIVGWDSVDLSVNDVITTINLGGTYYGGTLNITNGVLNVTKKYGKLPVFNYKGASAGVYLTPNMEDLKQAVTGNKIISMCDKFLAVNTVPANMLPDCSISVTNNTSRAMVCILDCDGMTVAQFNQYISDNVGDIYIVYELATPFDIQLTPTEIDALVGNNTIFADTGDVEVIYLYKGTPEA